MFWFSFDWDFVTGDHHNVRRNIASNVAWASDERYSRGYKWGENPKAVEKIRKTRLEVVYNLLQRVSIKRIILRDEHHLILSHLREGDRVWDIDAHWDCYRNGPYLNCGNWVRFARKRGIYVRSISKGQDVDCGRSPVSTDLFDRLRPPKEASLFICWSSDYTIPIWDDVLLTLLDGFPKVDFGAEALKKKITRGHHPRLWDQIH